MGKKNKKGNFWYLKDNYGIREKVLSGLLTVKAVVLVESKAIANDKASVALDPEILKKNPADLFALLQLCTSKNTAVVLKVPNVSKVKLQEVLDYIRPPEKFSWLNWFFWTFDLLPYKWIRLKYGRLMEPDKAELALYIFIGETKGNENQAEAQLTIIVNKLLA